MLIDRVNEKHKELLEEQTNNLSTEQKTDYERLNKTRCRILLFAGILSLIFFGVLIALLVSEDAFSKDTNFAIFLMVAINFLLICFILCFKFYVELHKRSKQEIYMAYLKAEDKNGKNDILRNAENIVIDEYLKSLDFSYTQAIHILTVKESWQYIFIDSATKRFKYLNLENDVDVTVNFNEIVSYEVYEDGKEIIKSKSGNVLLGGLLAGVPGMLVAQNSQREIEKPITSLKLVIRLNNFNQPQLVITFIDNNLYLKENYKSIQNTIYENLRLIYSNLEIIKHNHSQSSNIEELEPQKQNNLKDELVKLKELLDSDLITQEEYDAKKKQLLGLLC